MLLTPNPVDAQPGNAATKRITQIIPLPKMFPAMVRPLGLQAMNGEIEPQFHPRFAIHIQIRGVHCFVAPSTG